MAEITKVTTPMVPKENLGTKLRPVSDQAFDLTDPGKVHEAKQDGKAAERQSESNNLLKDSMGRPAIMPLLKGANDMMQVFKRVAFLVEMGVSASDVTNDSQVRELLDSLFVSPKDFAAALMEQDKASVLFKGEVFDALRDILSKFGDSPKIKDALANLLKTFDQTVNSQNSIKTILSNCNSILDYMFSKDRDQFSNYLQGLADMLLPKEEAAKTAAGQPQPQTGNAEQSQTAQQPQGVQQAQNQAQNQAQSARAAEALTEEVSDELLNMGKNEAAGQTENTPKQTAQTAQAAQETGDTPKQQAQEAGNTTKQAPQAGQPNPMQPKEMAQILKNNLLPLLGEIVVKYNQNERIRDVVMVVVHNIVRVDQGTPEALNAAVTKLAKELEQIAKLPPNFEKNLLEAVNASVDQAKNTPNSVISKLSDIISQTLSSPDANPAIMRQAENLLISMLQNQSAIMDVLHFMLPLQTPEGQVFTELYVDPETEENVGKLQGKSRKIFLSVESEAHGQFELCFLETNEHVDFSMWCSDTLVKPLSGMKKQFSDIMQLHGYTMNNFKIDEMKEPHSVAEVFPRLIDKKVGIDVQI